MLRAMPLDTLEFRTGEPPSASIIVMHGLGADATDFVSFVREVDLSRVGPVRWIFPAAPVRPVTLNNGMRMRAWYDLHALDFKLRREDEAGLRASLREVQALIEREIASGVPASRIVVGGFSQGCAMALLTALRAPQRLAGVLGMSGYLPLAATTAAERSEANATLPVFLGHGRFDPMIPVAIGHETRDALRALGHPVEWHEYPMEHHVIPQEIADLQAWLGRVLAPA
jgi:phospholipase/carboxylesterase